ncbi:hypothetical protein ASG63_17115 [Methylobacterium sp. Leaf94]|uniref:hypothetical protein n=2 Tax=unclassified Methylobacterium TaxID=2615210 RepID=UPI0006FC44ED|nr:MULTISPECIES: hypothetical protein [unclassified Methylobacterium]KQO72743.1 hypothetical protein ASF18_18600 [Methylobacterium sp. Leaf89]KQU30198.1 hypothetical protein ASG63_17115 [Methylobacterium sp. Leaf94]
MFMHMSRSALPALQTLAALPARDADMLLGSAERMCRAQSGREQQKALRRIAVYRRVLGLPPSMQLMQERWAASA